MRLVWRRLRVDGKKWAEQRVQKYGVQTMGRKEWVFRVSGLALNKSPDVIMLNNEMILD